MALPFDPLGTTITTLSPSLVILVEIHSKCFNTALRITFITIQSKAFPSGINNLEKGMQCNHPGGALIWVGVGGGAGGLLKGGGVVTVVAAIDAIILL